MKRLISVLAIGLLAPVGCALAQSWGISISRVYSWIDDNPGPGDILGTFATRTDVNAGLTYRIPLWQRLAFQPEIWYATKGSELRASSIARTRMTYVELPLTLRWGGVTPGRAGLRPVITGGLALSFLLSCMWQPRANTPLQCGESAVVPPESQPQLFPVPDALDVGTVIAGGVEWRTARGVAVALDARWTLGHRNLDPRYPAFFRHNRSWGYVLNVSLGGRKSAEPSR